MSQYSKRYRRYSLGILLVCAFALASCVTSPQAVQSNKPDQGAPLVDDTGSDDLIPVEQTPISEEGEDSPIDSSFDDIYSSFNEEMTEAVVVESDSVDDVPSIPPLEFLYSINGGNDALASDVPSWVTGERFMHFLQPSGFDLHNGELYILDSARQSMFRYQRDGQKIITILDLKMYMRGDADSLAFSDEGYYFISEPLSSRILKFNKQNLLVDVYKDGANLASPTKLNYDDNQKKLYVSDGVYSRIVVISQKGKLLYALGGRGSAGGEFTQITDFASYDGNVVVTDRMGKRPMQVINNEGVFLHAYKRDLLDIPSAVTVDDNERIYVADHSDDTIRIFVKGELRWRIGGPGTQPGKFRAVTQMRAYEDKLYVLDSLNRRIQVFQINGQKI